MKLVNLQKNNKSNKCICVNYVEKDWSKLITKQYNKHEYRHWYNLFITLFSKMYSIFKDTIYWPVHKIEYRFYPSPIKHSAFCFYFYFSLSLSTHECMCFTMFENQIKNFFSLATLLHCGFLSKMIQAK